MITLTSVARKQRGECVACRRFGPAFIPDVGRALADILCVQEERVVDDDTGPLARPGAAAFAMPGSSARGSPGAASRSSDRGLCEDAGDLAKVLANF